MRTIALMLMIAVVAVACSPDEATESTSTTLPSTTTTESTSTTVSPTTTLTPTSTSPPPTTTTLPPTTTTAPNPPPAEVTGVSAGLSGGSGEIFVSWDASAAADLSHYNIYFSVDPGATKALLVAVPGDKTDYVDFPRDLTEGINCYQVSAVDDGANEGPPSDEACFSAS